MDKRKKYFCVVAMVLILLSGYGKISDSAFRMWVTRMIAGEGMLRLVAAQYGQKAAEPVAETASGRSEKEDRPRVALTFDDGPNPEYTPKLLDGLEKRGVKATFFLLGEEVKQYPDVVRRMHDDGHLIGVHSYKHVNFKEVGTACTLQQIEKTQKAIYDVTGEYAGYIRPPYGCWQKELDAQVNLIEVLWNVDPRDWATTDADTVVQRVLKDTKPGDIILLHDASASSVQAALTCQ